MPATSTGSRRGEFEKDLANVGQLRVGRIRGDGREIVVRDVELPLDGSTLFRILIQHKFGHVPIFVPEHNAGEQFRQAFPIRRRRSLLEPFGML